MASTDVDISISTDFMTTLKEWVHSFVAAENKIRDRQQRSVHRAEALRWLKKRSEDVLKEVPKRPSKLRYYDHLQYEIRRIELSETFDTE